MSVGTALLAEMSKRPASDLLSNSAKASRNGLVRETITERDEMGEFEDAWEDEVEDEDVNEEDGDTDGVFASLCEAPLVSISV